MPVSSDLQRLIAWGFAQVGKPYVWGADGPDGFDCSGLTQSMFAAVGIKLPRRSQEQRNAGVGVPLGQIQPGDLVTFTYQSGPLNPGPANHVAVYAGGGKVLEASRPGTPVRLSPLDTAHVDRVRRVLGTGAGGAIPTSLPTGGGVQSVSLQQAGYDAVIDVTPWGIPLNPFKLPGWLGGKAQDAAGGFAWDSLGPLLLASVAVAGGAALVVGGLFVTARPAVESRIEKVADVVEP
jgi:hypothetical protein